MSVVSRWRAATKRKATSIINRSINTFQLADLSWHAFKATSAHEEKSGQRQRAAGCVQQKAETENLSLVSVLLDPAYKSSVICPA
jgi:hypothetical protein